MHENFVHTYNYEQVMIASYVYLATSIYCFIPLVTVCGQVMKDIVQHLQLHMTCVHV